MKVVFVASLLYVALVAVLAQEAPGSTRGASSPDVAAGRPRGARRRRGAGRGPRHDWRPIVAYLSAAVIPDVSGVFGDRNTCRSTVPARRRRRVGRRAQLPATHHWHLRPPSPGRRTPVERALRPLLLVLHPLARLYLVVPAIIMLWRRDRIRDYGLSAKGFPLPRLDLRALLRHRARRGGGRLAHREFANYYLLPRLQPELVRLRGVGFRLRAAVLHAGVLLPGLPGVSPGARRWGRAW